MTMMPMVCTTASSSQCPWTWYDAARQKCKPVCLMQPAITLKGPTTSAHSRQSLLLLSIYIALITSLLAHLGDPLLCSLSAVATDGYRRFQQRGLYTFRHIGCIAAYIDMCALLYPMPKLCGLLLNQMLHIYFFGLIARERHIKSIECAAHLKLLQLILV